MRADVRNLLDRLGKSDFAYKEFTDRFGDLQLWPIFELMLKDPRLNASGAAHAAGDARRIDPGVSNAVQSSTGDLLQEPLSSAFGRYEEGAPPLTASHPPQDIRAMLQHLSQLGEKGDL